MATKALKAPNVLLLSLSLLLGCQRHSQWVCHHIEEKNSNCTRILYQSQDQIAGIDLEFLQTGAELNTYLQVHSHPLAPCAQDRSQVQINIATGNKQSTFLAPFHKGQQRVHLSQALQEELLSLLMEGNPIVIELSGYRETITHENFAKVLKNLDKPAPRNPLRLPF